MSNSNGTSTTVATRPDASVAPRQMRVLKDVAPKLPELGRIRLGSEKTDPRKPGKPLMTFRVTSPDIMALEAVQKLYGGEIAPWESPDGPQFQMISEASVLNVAIPPDETAACSTSYEIWGASGCLCRCDGEYAMVNVPPVYKRDPKTRKVLGVEREGYSEERPCSCDPSNRECARVLRLNVILTDVTMFGVWRLETGSFYAAQEIPGVVRLAARFAQNGMPVPATLQIANRKQRSVVKGLRIFAVPVLRLAIPVTTQMLIGNAEPAVPAIAAPAVAEDAEPSDRPVIEDAEPVSVEPPDDDPFAGMDVAQTPGGQTVERTTGEVLEGEVVDASGWPERTNFPQSTNTEGVQPGQASDAQDGATSTEEPPAPATAHPSAPWAGLTFGQLSGDALRAFNERLKREGQGAGAFQRERGLTSLKDVPAAEIIAWASGGE